MKIIKLLSITFALMLILLPIVHDITVYGYDNDMFNEKITYNSSAKSAILMESSTKRIIYSKNADKQLPMASTTKIMTAITVLENCEDLDTPIIVDKRAIGTYGTSIYLREGEELTIRELLYGLMLRSGNDASVALACAVGGDVDTFCGMMNDLARKIGAKNSHFVNPHGLDTDEHYTTAYDLALIASYALENKDFAEIVSSKSKRICEDKENVRYLVNKNKLLNKLDGCIGVKTGFTDNAGRCLVSACERDGLRLIAVVFNCGPMFEESAEMFEFAFDKFSMFEILPPYNYIKSISVNNGESVSIGVCSKAGLSIPLTEQEKSNINIVYNMPTSVDAPINKDQEIGNVEIYYLNHLIFSEKVYTIEGVESKLYKDKIKEILENWNA